MKKLTLLTILFLGFFTIKAQIDTTYKPVPEYDGTVAFFVNGEDTVARFMIVDKEILYLEDIKEEIKMINDDIKRVEKELERRKKDKAKYDELLLYIKGIK